MLQKYKDKRQEGFTIIEVLIVLAIAGLIILIVFLAVPALQRNSRNTQRTNDGSLIAAGVNECLNNRNGQDDSCNAWTGEIDQFVDDDRLAQIETVAPGTALPGPNDLTTANFGFSERCLDDGSDVDPAASPSDRDFVVLYRVENTTGTTNPGRCISA